MKGKIKMIEDNYFNYKNYSLSVKRDGENSKVRLWQNDDNSKKLVSVKYYDKENDYITRNSENRSSMLPKSGIIQRGKNSNFFILDNQFKLQGKLKRGEITGIYDMMHYPQTESEFNKLGALARKFCKKVAVFASKANIEKELSPEILEKVRKSKVFETLGKIK